MPHVNQHGAQGFELRISKINRYSSKFCISKSVALIIPNVYNVFTQLNPLKEAFETTHTDKGRAGKGTELDDAFCKKFELLIDRFSSFFRKKGKSLER